MNLEQIAKQLGVAYVVEGSVRKAGQRVRINAQLIEGATGGHLWADRYDRDLTDIFAIQDEITKTIVDQLKVKLLPEEKKAIEQAPTDNVEAYTHYLRGRQFFHMGTKSSMTLGRRMFARAVELDPQLCARLCRHGGLRFASLFQARHRDFRPTRSWRPPPRRWRSSPILRKPMPRAAYALMIGSRPAEAASAFEQALALDPNCYEANQLLCRVLRHQGRLRAGRASISCAPWKFSRTTISRRFILSSVFQSLGRPEEAVKYARLGVKRAEEALRLHPENSKPAQLGRHRAGCPRRTRSGEGMAGAALAIDPDDNLAQYNAACTYSLLGEIDRAIDLLEICLQQLGRDMKLWFKNDSDLDPIRSHPRYQKLLELAG